MVIKALREAFSTEVRSFEIRDGPGVTAARFHARANITNCKIDLISVDIEFFLGIANWDISIFSRKNRKPRWTFATLTMWLSTTRRFFRCGYR